MASDFVTVDQVQGLLGISRSTVWRLIQSGSLPSLRRGARRLIPAAALAVRQKVGRAGNIPPLSENHPIFRLAGAGRSGGRLPGARDKHAILGSDAVRALAKK